MTIDGEHARDFDDAISIEQLPNGHYWLGVHIADVAHYVTEGTALDQEGYERATSVYFPDRAVHMFPSELATGICSLNPRVDRLVQSCLMEVDRERLGRAIRVPRRRHQHRGADDLHRRQRDPDRRSRRELMQTYRDLVPKFELMERAVSHLNGRRKRRGSIDFDLPEAEVIIDDAGRLRRSSRPAQHRAQADRRVHAAGQRDRRDLCRGPRHAVRCSASTSSPMF